jgi:hypothetical protein
VWSVTKRRFLSAKPSADGYVGLGLVGANGKTIHTHIVVKETFHGITPSGHVIDHIDRVKSNNLLSNLRFVTAGENTTNSDRSNHSQGLLRPVDQYDAEGVFVKSWASAREVESVLGCGASSINACCRDPDTMGFGYYWNYREDLIEGEIWLAFKGGLSCSDHGRIRFPSGRITYGTEHSGYRRIQFNKVHYLVHVIVCTSFNGLAPGSDMVVNHINEQKDDNRPVNLEWLSPADNFRHSNNKPVVQLTVDGMPMREFVSIVAASEFSKLDPSYISKACRNNTCAGEFRWIFKDAEDRIPAQ